ncbi:MAG: NrfD/PsrC family molybdoenzyme membrane anchor subunit [bacterium]
MKITYYKQIGARSLGFFGLLGALGLTAVIGLASAYHMEHEGHHITGMTNQIVWGLPHVFAIFLIVAASGALNIASISSVFQKKAYKPLARMSAVLAVTLLIGGLVILLLDLGRPDRLIVAITTYNFKSIFAWNIILYSGFVGIVITYLWTMMDRSVSKASKAAGFAAFLWRLILTTGTGSIFGFLVARQAYDAAIMAPMFVVMSFAFGLAIFILMLMAKFSWTGRELGPATVQRLGRLLGVFVAGVFYFVVVFHLTNIYGTENHGVESFFLLGTKGGSVYANLFWFGQLLVGTFIPLALLLIPAVNKSRGAIAAGSALVIIGGFIQLYIIVIGGQAYPLETFPGKQVIESSFFDGVSHGYIPTIWELLLGLGGVAVAFLLYLVASAALAITPVSLADKDVDPHSAA